MPGATAISSPAAVLPAQEEKGLRPFLRMRAQAFFGSAASCCHCNCLKAGRREGEREDNRLPRQHHLACLAERCSAAARRGQFIEVDSRADGHAQLVAAIPGLGILARHQLAVH